MAAGDLITTDWQIELNKLLMGNKTDFVITPPGIQGLGVPPLKLQDTVLTLQDGVYGGLDRLDKRVITVPLAINKRSAGVAMNSLTLVNTAWGVSQSDVPLYFRLPGWGKCYVEGRPRGCIENLEHLHAGVVHVLCTFEALNPKINKVGS